MGNGQFGVYLVGSGASQRNETNGISSRRSSITSRDYERVLYKVGRFPFSSDSAPPTPVDTQRALTSRTTTNTFGSSIGAAGGTLLSSKPLSMTLQRYDSNLNLTSGSRGNSDFPCTRNCGRSYNREFHYRDDFHLNYKSDYDTKPTPLQKTTKASNYLRDKGSKTENDKVSPSKSNQSVEHQQKTNYLIQTSNTLKGTDDCSTTTSDLHKSGPPPTGIGGPPYPQIRKRLSASRIIKGCQTDPSPWILYEHIHNDKLMVVTKHHRYVKSGKTYKTTSTGTSTNVSSFDAPYISHKDIYISNFRPEHIPASILPSWLLSQSKKPRPSPASYPIPPSRGVQTEPSSAVGTGPGVEMIGLNPYDTVDVIDDYHYTSVTTAPIKYPLTSYRNTGNNIEEDRTSSPTGTYSSGVTLEKGIVPGVGPKGPDFNGTNSPRPRGKLTSEPPPWLQSNESPGDGDARPTSNDRSGEDNPLLKSENTVPPPKKPLFQRTSQDLSARPKERTGGDILKRNITSSSKSSTSMTRGSGTDLRRPNDKPLVNRPSDTKRGYQAPNRVPSKGTTGNTGKTPDAARTSRTPNVKSVPSGGLPSDNGKRYGGDSKYIPNNLKQSRTPLPVPMPPTLLPKPSSSIGVQTLPEITQEKNSQPPLNSATPSSGGTSVRTPTRNEKESKPASPNNRNFNSSTNRSGSPSSGDERNPLPHKSPSRTPYSREDLLRTSPHVKFTDDSVKMRKRRSERVRPQYVSSGSDEDIPYVRPPYPSRSRNLNKSTPTTPGAEIPSGAPLNQGDGIPLSPSLTHGLTPNWLVDQSDKNREGENVNSADPESVKPPPPAMNSPTPMPRPVNVQSSPAITNGGSGSAQSPPAMANPKLGIAQLPPGMTAPSSSSRPGSAQSPPTVSRPGSPRGQPATNSARPGSAPSSPPAMTIARPGSAQSPPAMVHVQATAVGGGGGLRRYPSQQGPGDGPVFMARKHSINQLKESLSRQQQSPSRQSPKPGVKTSHRGSLGKMPLTIPSTLSLTKLKQGEIKVVSREASKTEMRQEVKEVGAAGISDSNYVILRPGSPTRPKHHPPLKSSLSSKSHQQLDPTTGEVVQKKRSVHFRGVPPPTPPTP